MQPTTLKFAPEQFLFRENDVSNTLYLIQQGTVSIRKRKGSGFVEVARIYEKEIVGEISFFDRLPRSADAVALTAVEAVQIDFESLDKIYTDVPAYLKTIMSAMAERLRRADDMIRRMQKDPDYKEESESAADSPPKA